MCVFVDWTPPFWDTLFPFPNCFLLSEQKLHMRQSGPIYFKQIQTCKLGHGWVQLSVTLWKFTPVEDLPGCRLNPCHYKSQGCGSLLKKLQFSLSQWRVKSCGFPKGFCSTEPITPESSGLSDKKGSDIQAVLLKVQSLESRSSVRNHYNKR